MYFWLMLQIYSTCATYDWVVWSRVTYVHVDLSTFLGSSNFKAYNVNYTVTLLTDVHNKQCGLFAGLCLSMDTRCPRRDILQMQISTHSSLTFKNRWLLNRKTEQ